MAKLAADLEGRTMGGLASRGRRGDTMLAYINPQEAEMLMEEGGSGTINPMTGLPEFFWSADTSADDEGNPGDAGDAGYDFEEAMAFAESANLIGNKQGNFDNVDETAYKRAAIADPNLPTGDPWDPSTPANKGGIPQKAKAYREKEEKELLEWFRLVEQLKTKKPGEKVKTASGRIVTKADIKARDAEREVKAAVRAKDSLPRDNEGKVSYMALFDRYATPKERDMKTEIKNGVTIRTNRVDPPDTSELIDRHYKANGLVEVKDRAGQLRLANDPGWGYSKENVYDKLRNNRDEWEEIKFLSSTLPGGARLRDRSGNLLAPQPSTMVPVTNLAGGGKVDGIQALADSIESYGRKGDTMLAHINPKEAQMLKDAGGSGTINPVTGLPEFYDMGFGSYSDAEEAEAASAANLEAGWAMADAAAEQAAIDAAVAKDKQTDIDLDLEKHYGKSGTFDSPSTPNWNERGGFDYDKSGATGPSDTYSLNRSGQLETDKDGNIIWPEEYWPYLNQLAEGRTMKEAESLLAGILNSPGMAGSLTSGFLDGYSYGGPMGTLLDSLETGRTNVLVSEAAKARKKQDKEDKELDDFVGEPDIEQEPGFMDKFANILGLDDFSLKSFNPFGGPTSEQQAIFNSLSDQGMTNVQARSLMDQAIGFGASAAMPSLLSGIQTIGGRLTGTNIIGTATDPVTGLDYLVEAGGGLQLAGGQLDDLSYGASGNEPDIINKRKKATKKPKEEEKKEEVKKPSFPTTPLPRLTESGLETVRYAYRNDPPEVLDNILNKYTLPNQTSGLKALV